MGEIDTKPIDSVQVAISMFGEKGDHSKHRSSSSDSDVEKEKDIGLGGLEKELASYRLQLEAKDSAYKQVVLQLEHYKKTTAEISVLLKSSELERNKCIEECNEVKNQVDELECKMKEMVNQLSETAKLREQLSNVLNELKVTQSDLLDMETELADAKDSELKAMTKAELMETSANMEKEKSEELLGRISELQNAVHISKLAATEAEKEKCRIESEKNAEIEPLMETAYRAQEEVEDLRKQLEKIEDLENQLFTKSAYINSLQAKLEQVTNVLGSLDNAILDGEIDMNQIKQDLEFKERKISDQAFYIEALETELNRLKSELENANEEVRNLNRNVEALKSYLEKLEIEVGEARERENDAQAKKENQMLKQEAEEAGECRHVGDPRDKCVDSITISIEEYNFLIRKANKEDHMSNSVAEDYEQLTSESENHNEVELLKKQLEVANVKVGLFRNRAEQAATRAEAAEKAKATLEDQLRHWQEQKLRRKAALSALREESAPKQFGQLTIEMLPATRYQPLGKVLNIKL